MLFRTEPLPQRRSNHLALRGFFFVFGCLKLLQNFHFVFFIHSHDTDGGFVLQGEYRFYAFSVVNSTTRKMSKSKNNDFTAALISRGHLSSS